MTNKELQDKLKTLPPDFEIRMWIEGCYSGIYGIDLSNNGNFIDLLDVEED